MKLHPTLFALTLAAAFAGHAQAFTFNGTTVGGPTWTRPIEDLSSLSFIGVDVRYAAQAFSVTSSGDYTFLSTAAANWDNFTFLYQASFNPLAPLSNVLIGNDDRPTLGLSGFSYALTAGTSYVFVTTGFQPGDAGAYSNSIDGPGSVIPSAVPEAESALLMALGLAGLLLVARRRHLADSH